MSRMTKEQREVIRKQFSSQHGWYNANVILDLLANLDSADQEIEQLRTDLAESELADEAVQAKIRSLSAHETCACSLDRPGDICGHHSPRVMQLEAELAACRAMLSLLPETEVDRLRSLASAKAFVENSPAFKDHRDG